MENLRRIIGPAPSEMSREELVAKIRKRQEFVGSLLQRFREQSASLPPRASKERQSSRKAGGKAGNSAALGDLMREMKEMGMTMKEFKKIARGKGE